MRRGIIIVMMALMSVIGSISFAQNSGSDTVDPPIPSFTTQTGLVIDTTGSLPAETERQLEFLAQQINQAGTSVAIAIFTNCACETVLFATEIGQQNGIGDADTDKGIVIAVFTDKAGSGGQKPAIGLAVGMGLEETLTDGRAGRLLDATFVPQRAQGNWPAGLVSLTQELQKFLGGQPSAADEEGLQLTPEQLALIVILGLIFLGVDGIFFRFAITILIIEILARSAASGSFSSSSAGGSRRLGGGGGFRGGGAGR